MKKEFNLKSIGMEYSFILENTFLIKKVFNKNINKTIISKYKILKKDVKIINSVLDTIEFITADINISKQAFFIGVGKNSMIFYLTQVENNIHKNMLEFKAILVEKQEI